MNLETMEFAVAVLSLLITAMDFGISIYDRLKSTGAANQEGRNHQINYITVNKTIVWQYVFLNSRYTQPNCSRESYILFALMLIAAVVVQNCSHILFIALAASTALFLCCTRFGSKEVYVPLSREKYLFWLASPGIALQLSLLCMFTLNSIPRIPLFGSLVDWVLRLIVYGVIGMAFSSFIVQHILAVIVPRLHQSNVLCNYIRNIAIKAFSLWFLPVLGLVVIEISLLINLVVFL